MKSNILFAALLSIGLLSACGPSQPPAQVVYQQPGYAYQQQPTVVVQDNSGAAATNGLVTGMMLGHMMSGGSRGYDSHTTVVNKTVVVNNHSTTVAPAAPVAAPAPVRQSTYIPAQRAAAPTVSRAPTQSFGGFKRK